LQAGSNLIAVPGAGVLQGTKPDVGAVSNAVIAMPPAGMSGAGSNPSLAIGVNLISVCGKTSLAGTQPLFSASVNVVSIIASMTMANRPGQLSTSLDLIAGYAAKYLAAAGNGSVETGSVRYVALTLPPRSVNLILDSRTVAMSVADRGADLTLPERTSTLTLAERTVDLTLEEQRTGA
jgi:hypothetical protein